MKKFFALMPKNNKECTVEWSTSNSLKVKYLLIMIDLSHAFYSVVFNKT